MKVAKLFAGSTKKLQSVIARSALLYVWSA
jgi:hypothetical protein